MLVAQTPGIISTMENWDEGQKQSRVTRCPLANTGLFPGPSSCRIGANTGLMRWLEINSVAPCESRAETRITFTICQLGPGARGMHQWQCGQPIRGQPGTNGGPALVNGLYLCGSKFLAHPCINPNHNNKSKGHCKLDIYNRVIQEIEIHHTL